MTRAIHEPLAHDGCSATRARVSGSAIDIEAPSEVAAAAVDIHVQLVETGTSGLQGSLHPGSGLAQDGVRPALAERGPGGVEAGAWGELRLVGVVVGDSASPA